MVIKEVTGTVTVIKEMSGCKKKLVSLTTGFLKTAITTCFCVFMWDVQWFLSALSLVSF